MDVPKQYLYALTKDKNSPSSTETGESLTIKEELQATYLPWRIEEDINQKPGCFNTSHDAEEMFFTEQKGNHTGCEQDPCDINSSDVKIVKESDFDIFHIEKQISKCTVEKEKQLLHEKAKYDIDITEHKIDCPDVSNKLSYTNIYEDHNKASNNSNNQLRNTLSGDKLVDQKPVVLNHGNYSQQIKIKMYICDCEPIEDHEIKDFHKISYALKTYSNAGHSKTDFYECENCNKIYSVVEGFRYHINNKFSTLYHMTKKDYKNCKCRGIKRYVCQVCDQLFINIKYLKRHNKLVHTEGRKYVCGVCDRKFLSLLDLKNHIYGVCEKKYECEECHKKYPHLFRIREHINRAHIRVKNCVCEECGKTFFGKNNLVSHKKVHSEIKYTCQECGKTYNTIKSLKHHTNVIHEDVKVYNKNAVCNECNKVFSSSNHRKRHVDTVHRGIKKFKCPSCNRTFTQLSNMKIHISGVHYGIKKYECELCLRTFLHFRDLKIHMNRAHIGGKDFVSQECQKKVKLI